MVRYVSPTPIPRFIGDSDRAPWEPDSPRRYKISGTPAHCPRSRYILARSALEARALYLAHHRQADPGEPYLIVHELPD